ncbi:MAG: N-acetylglucosamine-6-phosphate deacetylase [Sphingobacteriales bacterium]|nr:N-acetylglucosamine-6-phosphate deacetylase [Sphingobacteriales bacterium]
MADPKIFTANRIFTGEHWLENYAVVTEAGIITDLLPATELPAASPLEDFGNSMLVPAFIDLQIYGAYGKLLAVYPDTDSLSKLSDYCRKGGAAYCLPAVATNTYEVFHQCIEAIRAYWKQGGDCILGLHIEGPWINPVKRGAHIEKLIHSPSLEEAEKLLEFGKGVIKIITLAPEVVSKELILLIQSYGVVVAAGHSNATYAQAKNGFANGIRAVTHLYNAMSPLQHREPGLTGAAMDDEQVMASIIPDGHHVDYAAIRIAKKTMGERLFVITDAVTDTGSGYYRHERNGDKYVANDTLSGSALTMNKAMQNLLQYAGVELGEAIRMCSLYPARVMRMEDRLGKIEKGYSASLLLLDPALNVIKLL